MGTVVEVEIGAVVEVHVVALAALVVVEVSLAFPERWEEILLEEILLKECYKVALAIEAAEVEGEAHQEGVEHQEGEVEAEVVRGEVPEEAQRP